MSDSEKLRKDFDQPDIADGWEILAFADDSQAYEGHWWMVLRGPDGLLYENDSGHCSCYGMEGQFGPVETNLEALRKTLESEAKYYSYKTEKATELESLINRLMNGGSGAV